MSDDEQTKTANATRLAKRRVKKHRTKKCLWCEEDADVGQKLCEDHQREQRQRYVSMREIGVCVRCRKPTEGDAAQCNTCKEKNRIRMLAHREKKAREAAEKQAKAEAKKLARKLARERAKLEREHKP